VAAGGLVSSFLASALAAAGVVFVLSEEEPSFRDSAAGSQRAEISSNNIQLDFIVRFAVVRWTIPAGGLAAY
jgi:hypothetical protein